MPNFNFLLLLLSDVHWTITGRAFVEHCRSVILLVIIWHTVLIAVSMEHVHLLAIEHLISHLEGLPAQTAFHLVNVFAYSIFVRE